MTLPNNYVIKSNKQSNGVWGMPLQCIFLDEMPSDSKQELHSALCIAIAEIHPVETFMIMFSSNNGFVVKFNNGVMKPVSYHNYILKDNVLIWNQN